MNDHTTDSSTDLTCFCFFFSLKGLVQLGKERRARLEDSLRLYKFFGDMEEEEMFVKETEKVLSSKEVGKDLISLTRLQQKHKVSVMYPEFVVCNMAGNCITNAENSTIFYFKSVSTWQEEPTAHVRSA